MAVSLKKSYVPWDVRVLADDEDGFDVLLDEKHYVCIGQYDGPAHYLDRNGDGITVMYRRDNGSYHVTVSTNLF